MQKQRKRTHQGEIMILREKLRSALEEQGSHNQEREDSCFRIIYTELEKSGRFYRDEEGTPYFFPNSDRKLLEIDSVPDSRFGRMLTHMTDLSLRATPMRNVLDRLRGRTSVEAPAVTVHALAYNSPDAARIAINDFGGGMWVRERGGKWEWALNGTDGILFYSPDAMVQPLKPHFGSNLVIQDIDHVHHLLDQAHFADDVLTDQDQRLLMLATLLVPFFPYRNRTRPVPAHLGLPNTQSHDSGKTTFGKMLGCLWCGEGFQPMPITGSEKDREATQLKLMYEPYVLLDNVDTQIGWLNDFLCTYATGGQSQRRKLYRDTERVTYPIRGCLSLTSRQPQFTREDTASRIIPFRFRPIMNEERKPEWQLLEPIIHQRGQIWAGLLGLVAQIQDIMPTRHPPQPSLRLADFDSFGWYVATVLNCSDGWDLTMKRLQAAQAGFAMNDDPVCSVLKELLSDGDIPEQTTGDFFKCCNERLRESGSYDSPRDASALSKKLNQSKKMLEAVLDITILTRMLHGHTVIEIRRGESWNGE